MRILILSCNTGQGHNSASLALKEGLVKNGDECDVEDALRFISKVVSTIMEKGHIFMYRHIPGVFRWGYAYAERHRAFFEEDTFLYNFFAQGTERLYKFCRDGKYDVIICSHVFSALMMTDVKKNHNFNTKICFLATDYTCSPSAEQSKMDAYFIPAIELTEEFTKLGIPKERIVPSGIPVRSMFFEMKDKISAKSEFCTSPNCKHAVLMCGSMGCGPIERLAAHIIQKLTKEQELSIVCGTNKKLQKKLTKKYRNKKQVHVLGYVKNVSELLDSADLYITKPGGISVTEAAIKKVPMVFIDAVAGCEDYNMHYYMSRGCAVKVTPVSELAKLCVFLLSDSDALRRMKAAFEEIEIKNAMEYISEKIHCLNKEETNIAYMNTKMEDAHGKEGKVSATCCGL